MFNLIFGLAVLVSNLCTNILIHCTTMLLPSIVLRTSLSTGSRDGVGYRISHRIRGRISHRVRIGYGAARRYKKERDQENLQ